MRSREAVPSLASKTPDRRLLSAASFAFLFAPSITGCEAVHHAMPGSPERPRSEITRIQQEGMPRTMERVLALAVPTPAEQTRHPAFEFSTLRINGDWENISSPAHSMMQAFEGTYPVVAMNKKPLQTDHIVTRGNQETNDQLVLHTVELSYRATRTVVRNVHEPRGTSAARTQAVGQQVLARPVGERLPGRGPGPELQERHWTAVTYGAALGEILYQMGHPTDTGAVDAHMHADQARSIRNHQRFQGEICGPVTGIDNTIYCTRVVNQPTVRVVIDDIRQEIDPSGLVRVSVLYHGLTQVSEPPKPDR